MERIYVSTSISKLCGGVNPFVINISDKYKKKRVVLNADLSLLN